MSDSEITSKVPKGYEDPILMLKSVILISKLYDIIVGMKR